MPGIRWNSERVDDHETSELLAQILPHRAARHDKSIRVAVHRHSGGAERHHRVRKRHATVSGNSDVIPRFDAKRNQRQSEGGESTGDRNCMSPFADPRQLLFEPQGCRPHGPMTGAHHLSDGRNVGLVCNNLVVGNALHITFSFRHSDPRRAFAECRVDFVAYAYALCNRPICPGSGISIGSREDTPLVLDQTPVEKSSDGKGWRG